MRRFIGHGGISTRHTLHVVLRAFYGQKKRCHRLLHLLRDVIAVTKRHRALTRDLRQRQTALPERLARKRLSEREDARKLLLRNRAHQGSTPSPPLPSSSAGSMTAPTDTTLLLGTNRS